MKTDKFNLLSVGRALAACLIALAPVALSCDVSELDDRLTELENRVTDLESELVAEISALQELLDGNVTVVSCELDETTGIYTIILSDGTTIEVAQAGEEAVSSVVGVFEEDGKYYWTLNGEPMLADGEYVPVSVTPGIRVNSSTNEWEVSPDGGTTWLSTGITASDGSSIFAKVEEDDGYVYFTLGDGTSVKVAKAVDFECSVLAGKQYFSYGETKEINLTLKNVSKTAVTKPDGWKASVDGSVLSITAPAQENTYAETDGKVSVLAVSSNGEFSMSEVSVAVGSVPHAITIGDDMSISISVSDELANNWETWAGYYYGISLLEDFSAESVVASIEADTRAELLWDPVSSRSFAEIFGSSYDETRSYVVWCIDRWMEDYENQPLDPEEMIFETVLGLDIEMTVSDITFEDASISVSVSGISSYYAGVIEKSDNSIETILGNLEGGGSAYTVLSGNYEGLLSEYGMYEESGWSEPNVISPGVTYLAFLVPVEDDSYTYTEDDVYTCEAVIPAITLGGTASVSVGEVTADYTSVSAVVTPGTDAYKFFVTYLSEDQMAEYPTDTELLEYLVSQTSRSSEYSYSKTGLQSGAKGYIVAVAVDRNGLAGDIVKAEANTSELTFSDVTVTATASSVSWDSATITFAGEGIASYRYLYTTQSGLSSYPFGTYSGGRDDDQIEEVLAMDSYYSIQEAVATDGSASVELSGLSTNTVYYLFVVGVDADGVVTHLAECSFTPSLSDVFVESGSDRYNSYYETNKPVLSDLKFYDPSGDTPEVAEPTLISSLTEMPSGYGIEFIFDASIGEKCERYWVLLQNPSYVETGAFEDEDVIAILGNSRVVEYSGDKSDYTHDQVYNTNYSTLYIVWQDDEGYIYPAEIIDLKTLLSTGSGE